MTLLTATWSWYIAGPILGLIMILLILFGETFGFSSNLRTACTMCGAGRFSDFFRINKRHHYWNLVFLLGSIIGGFIAFHLLSPDHTVDVAASSVAQLESMGFSRVGDAYLPSELFGTEDGMSLSSILLLLIGGLMVGFGARYAGGCTSGHAISGLSNMQLPSLLAVVGFFIGGLTMVHLIFPIIF